jgi:large-conductance mechanosensitive channel
MAMAVVVGAFAASLVCALAQSVIAPGAKLEKLSTDFSFAEGPTCDATGNLFFTDQNNIRFHPQCVQKPMFIGKAVDPLAIIRMVATMARHA